MDIRTVVNQLNYFYDEQREVIQEAMVAHGPAGDAVRSVFYQLAAEFNLDPDADYDKICDLVAAELTCQ